MCENITTYETLKDIADYAAPIITIFSGLLGLFTKTRKESIRRKRGKEVKKEVLTKWAWYSLVGIIVGAVISLCGLFLDKKITGIENCIKAEKDSLYNEKVDRANKLLINSRDTLTAILKSSSLTVDKLNETYSKQLVGIEKQNVLLNKTELVVIKMDSVYEMDKKIKYPLPEFVSVSYNVFFQVEEKLQRVIDTIFMNKPSTTNEIQISVAGYGLFLSLDKNIIHKLKNDIFKWDNAFNNQISLWFTNKYEIAESQVSANPTLLRLSNREEVLSNISINLNGDLLYNSNTKTFLFNIKNIRLQQDKNNSLSLSHNLKSNSLFDLNGSSIILLHTFPKSFKSIKLFNLTISSKELNQSFREAKNTLNKGAYIW